MEAWILHIREEREDSLHEIHHSDIYSAWSTEKQAYKAAGKWFVEVVVNSTWKNPFYRQSALSDALLALVEAQRVEEAVNLVNECSQRVAATPGITGSGSKKITIKITQSKFLGSVFE
jgi:hypothetical protein